MKSFVRHSAVLTASAFVNSEIGEKLGESASNLNYSTRSLPFPLHTFEVMGRMCGAGVGIICGIGALTIAACHRNTTN